MSRIPIVALSLACLCAAATAQSLDQREPTVGMRARIEQVVLPGSELVVKPVVPEDPIVLRIVDTWPHGTAFRYDLEYYGLDPGEHDLSKYLVRKDGSPTGDLPAIPVTIRSVLPPGQVVPNELQATAPPALGGYTTLLITAGILWGAGLAGILLMFRRRRRALAQEARPVTLADRMRPLLEAARSGALGDSAKAELERLLLEYWRRRLDLQGKKAGEAIATMRQHPEAGAVLRQLELWLHKPGSDREVDVAALLEPYRNVPAEAPAEAG